MCGICGWVAFTRNFTTELSTLWKMTDIIRFQGPDARGIWVDQDVTLGHHRLAVIDLVGGE